MCGFKLGWLVPVFVLIILLIVMGVGIYQTNSNKNPWNFSESNVSAK